MRIVVATNNQGKLKEFRSIFVNHEVLGLKDLNYQKEIIEEGNTFEENALKKAKQVSKDLNTIAIADDSGLEVEALNNEPGIYSARYSKEQTDEANNKLLIKNLKNKENRNAQYVCAICIYYPNDEYLIVKDTCKGKIIDEPHGTNGFGYDPYFYSYDCNKTFAEITLEEKNKYSHRAKALRKLGEMINEDLSIKR